ncbi:MAG: PH domain-containing protein [Clostridia bacterium]|nr:PH domain-containing protein [Clostridia bacterium]
MIDFKNKTLFKLKQESNEKGYESVSELLVENEQLVASFVSMRDRVVFTNKRIISINVQGFTGAKIDYTSIPYSKIQLFSVETAGTIDLDSELDIWLSSIGKIRFELTGNTDIRKVAKIIGEYVL